MGEHTRLKQFFSEQEIDFAIKKMIDNHNNGIPCYESFNDKSETSFVESIFYNFYQ